MNNFYRGNLSKDLRLTELETKHYWYRVKNSEAVVKNGGGEYKIMAFTVGQMNGFKKNKQENNIDFWELAGWPEPVCLHNPELTADIETLKID